MRAPLQIKTAAASLLCSAPVGHALGRLFGHRFRSGDCWISTEEGLVGPRTEAALFWGLYESAEVRLVRQWLRADLDVIELGSSIGVVSSHVARRLEAGRRLVCVEANPSLLHVLAANVRANAPALDVSLRHGAIAYGLEPGADVPLALGETNVASRLATPDVAAPTVRVPALTLRELLRTEPIGSYALVADIEGAEAGLLLHETRALRACEQIFVELHETTADGCRYGVEDLLDLLVHSHGFALRARHGPVCFLEREESR